MPITVHMSEKNFIGKLACKTETNCTLNSFLYSFVSESYVSNFKYVITPRGLLHIQQANKSFIFKDKEPRFIDRK
jgi:hypothetical protein